MIATKIPSAGRTADTIGDWIAKHELTADEVERIQAVLADPGIDDVDAAMLEELEGVLAARRIAKMNLPTAESLQALRNAFEEGRLPVTSIPAD